MYAIRSYYAGTQQSIIWNDNIAENVMIELFKGGFLDSVITISTPSDGSFIWDIPANTVLDSDYTIKLTSVSDPGLFVITSYSIHYTKLYENLEFLNQATTNLMKLLSY